MKKYFCNNLNLMNQMQNLMPENNLIRKKNLKNDYYTLKNKRLLNKDMNIMKDQRIKKESKFSVN